MKQETGNRKQETGNMKHDTGQGHPESPERLVAIERQIRKSGLYEQLTHYEAPLVTGEQLERVHAQYYLKEIELNAPTVDGNTVSLIKPL